MNRDPVPDEPLGMVLVMGVTGSGKSYFINKLAEGSVKEGPGLQAGTCTSIASGSCL